PPRLNRRRARDVPLCRNRPCLASAAFESDDSPVPWLRPGTGQASGGGAGTIGEIADGGSGMTGKAKLRAKSRDVVPIQPTATLAEAAKLLAERRIGAVLVLGIEGRLAGILSERDIVRVLAERGGAVLGERVDQVMTRKVFTCSENDTVAQIMEQMT